VLGVVLVFSWGRYSDLDFGDQVTRSSEGFGTFMVSGLPLAHTTLLNMRDAKSLDAFNGERKSVRLFPVRGSLTGTGTSRSSVSDFR